MQLYMIMNRPLLDYDSTRNIIVNGVATITMEHDLHIDVAVPSVKDPPVLTNINTVSFVKKCTSFSNYFEFFAKLLPYTRKYLKNNRHCIVQHFLSARRGLDSFDLPAVVGLLKEHSFVVGPAEVVHDFMADDYRIYLAENEQISRRKYAFLRSANQAVFLQLFKGLFASTIDQCDVFIVAYEQARDYYRNFVPNSKIRTISYGTDLINFTYSKPPQNNRLLFVGNLTARKGIDYLIKSISIVKKSYPMVMLDIVGEGPQRQHLIELSRRLGLESKVIFHTRMANSALVENYRSCRVFCQPSLSEGFSHVILEAMASGRPIVSTNTPGAYMVKDSENGFVVPVASTQALSDRIIRLFGDYELCLKLATAARRTVELHHNWSIIANQYYELYQRLT
jgi:glycosyltransferase involved in cell wall biosynthesis